MKKLVLTFAVSLFVFTAYSQSVSIGAKAGVNFATINTDDDDDLDSRTAFHFGAVVDIPVSEKFSIQPELVFSAQGASESFEGVDIDYKANYLNLPVMAKFEVTDGLSLEVGPQIGFLTSAKVEAEGEEEDIKDELKGTDFGANFGIGYTMESGLNFSARYNLGLSDINDSPDDNTEIKNGVFQISIGYFFN